MGFGAWGWGLRFGVWGWGLGIQIGWFMVSEVKGLRLGVLGLGFRLKLEWSMVKCCTVNSLDLRCQLLGFRVKGLRLRF